LAPLGILLLCLPHIYAFGTASRGYTAIGSFALIFWLMGLTVFLATISRNAQKTKAALAVTAASTLVILCGLVRYYQEYPYRQSTPLRGQNEAVASLSTGHDFLISKDMAAYLSSLQALAYKSGFQKGDWLIDMTGRTPGAAYFLGAQAPGTPWLPGSYKASRYYVTSILDRLPPEDLRKAWVLVEPKGLRPNDPAWLEKYGLRVEKRPKLGPVIAPGDDGKSSFEQFLLKPTP
jgi:hypothetical protein